MIDYSQRTEQSRTEKMVDLGFAVRRIDQIFEEHGALRFQDIKVTTDETQIRLSVPAAGFTDVFRRTEDEESEGFEQLLEHLSGLLTRAYA